MKALALKAVGELELIEAPDPVPSAGEVLLKIKASGICGSDIPRIYKKGTYRFPTVPGHEFAGEIVKTGEGAPESYIGKAAAVFPLLPCKKCAMCEIGEYALCENYDYFGSRRDGGFAEYVSVPVWNLVFADGLSYEELALAEPAAVSVHALSRAGVGLNDTVAIFGAGAIGLMLAEFAAASGAGKIILFDVDDKKLDFARQIGRGNAINNYEKGWLDKFYEITGGKGADLCVEGAGAAQAAEGCFAVAGPMGKVVLMGSPSGDMLFTQAGYWEILRKQLTVYGTWNSDYSRFKNDWKTAAEAMAEGTVDLKRLVTHRFKLGEYRDAFGLLLDKSKFSCRVMFTD